MARTALQTFLDIADTASRSTDIALVMCRASWFHLVGLPRELQDTIEDLSIDKENLFNTKTEEVLHTMKDSRAILCTLGIYIPATRRKLEEKKQEENFENLIEGLNNLPHQPVLVTSTIHFEH